MIPRDDDSLMKSILYYEVVQEQIRRTLKSVSRSTVRYEDMVVDPGRTLQAMLEPSGLNFIRASLRGLNR